MRPIDADALSETLKDWRGDRDDLDVNDIRDVAYYQAMSRAIRITEGAPTLDYAPVRHGEWERMDEYCNHSKEFKCTACKQSVFYDHFTRFCEYEYCPNCGARMGGEK